MIISLQLEVTGACLCRSHRSDILSRACLLTNAIPLAIGGCLGVWCWAHGTAAE
ncbi:MAG: hypothetical protein GDA48_24950 [Hormoscilla sp. GM102CHS1]|nr:hypothetical protein [Hormoscilla sp. GM102CHS1]